jgi:hypothetical protein
MSTIAPAATGTVAAFPDSTTLLRVGPGRPPKESAVRAAFGTSLVSQEVAPKCCTSLC